MTRDTPATGDVGLMVAPVPIGSPMVVAPVKSSKGPNPDAQVKQCFRFRHE